MTQPTVDDYLHFDVDRQHVYAAINRFAAPTNIGIYVFVLVFAAFWCAVAGAVLLPEFWMRLSASGVAGILNAPLSFSPTMPRMETWRMQLTEPIALAVANESLTHS